MPAVSSRRLSITARLTIAFSIVVIFVAALYSAAAMWTLETTETLLVSEFLTDDLDHALEALESGKPVPRQPNVKLYGTGLEPIPEQYRHLETGYTELVKPEPLFAYYRRLPDGREFLLLRDQMRMEAFEQSVQIRMLLSIAAVLAAGLWVGWFLSRFMTSPVKALTAEVRGIAAADKYRPLSVPLGNDEIGDLARMFDLAMHCFDEALTREKRFTEDVSHELRTPLTVLQSSLELLSERDLDPRSRAHVEKMTEAVGQMRVLTELFLNFAREGKGSETLPLGETLAKTTESWKEAAGKKGLALLCSTRAPCPGSFAPVLVATVLNNLLRNALAYTDTGSVEVVQTAEGFEVRDTGRGIPDDEKAAVFDRYKRLDESRSGAGVGLNLVRRICRHAGWTITVADNPGGGTVFAVNLTDGKAA